MEHDVFISYSTKDQKTVEDISQYLEQNGIRCFVAFRDIPKSVVWAKAITEAIENCKMMVVVFSENANSSDQMDREIELCVEEKKPVLPFRIQDTKLTGVKKYYLKNINWINAFPNPEKSFGELLKSVQILLPDRTMDNSSAIRPTKEERETEERDAKEAIAKRESVTTPQQQTPKPNAGFESKPVQPPQPVANFKNQKPAAKPKPASYPPRTKKTWAIIGGIASAAILLFFIVISNIKQDPIIQELINNMMPVEGGTFTMGCTDEQGNDCDKDEKTTHPVTVSSFQIGKHQVTQAQWKAVMGTTLQQQRDKANPDWSLYGEGDNYPMYYVSWYDIAGNRNSGLDSMVINGTPYYDNGFIYKLNAQTGKQYRLPTEAEWEFAARGGKNSRGYKYSGSNTVDSVAWYTSNREGKTHDVGKKQANELGLYDMSGNVWEWCSDWYGAYTAEEKTNPTGPIAGSNRVLRGGSWLNYAQNCRVSYRTDDAPAYRGNRIGFRLALIP